MADNKSREFGVTVDEKGTAIDVRKSKSNLTVKIDVDISEALTGLKALQREAKKATQALRELESASQPIVVAPLTVGSPFVAPLTVTDVPDHVKDYSKPTQTYVSTDTKPQAWFKDGAATLHAGEVVLPREQAEKLANYKSDTLAVDGEHLEEFVRKISEALAVKADE